jgi:hypothetical protein
MALTSFGYGVWRSMIRKEVIIHPKYANMGPWTKRETSDLVYKDNRSSLTTLLIVSGYLDVGIWAGAKPEYYIEVKTTTGECNDRFFMSGNQYKMVCPCINNYSTLRDSQLCTLANILHIDGENGTTRAV